MDKQLAQYAAEIQMEKLAGKIIMLAREELMQAMPYMDRVLMSMPVEYYVDDGRHPERAIGFGSDGTKITAVPSVVLDIYMSGVNRMNRLLFHTLLHCLFNHMFAYEKMDGALWDLCTDIAVENVILELDLPALSVDKDDVRRQVLVGFLADLKNKNAETIYKCLSDHPKRLKEVEKYAWLFRRDRHDLWRSGKEDQNSSGNESQQRENWDKLRRSVDQAARSYEKSRGLEPGTISRNFHAGKIKHQDYSELLSRFVMSEERLAVDMDSFDYVYYTYGLSLYKNMPLIEPLEYKTDKRIHDFVIAVDTSGSCEGPLVEKFLRATCNILRSSNAFDETMNVHIIQCDAKIQEEMTVSSSASFDEYMAHFSIKGMGGTDFRPVFERVEQEVKDGVFKDLRGLIYFTDGRGTFPSSAPSFKTAFVFMENERDNPSVPEWAAKIVIDEDDL